MGITLRAGVVHFSTGPWFVFLMLFLAVAWVALVFTFFAALRKCDPHSYESMGKPSFSKGSSFFLVMSYIYRRAHRKVDHRAFSLLCDVMCVWAVLTLLLWIVGIFGLGGPPVDM